MDLETGSNAFGKFEILEHIGAGGMASVYKARHIHLDKIVVLKILKTDTVRDSAVVRFHNEAKIVSQLSHPNINQFFDFGVTSDNQPYLAIDFIEGRTLDKIITDDFYSLSIEDKLIIACQLIDALVYAHGKNIVHRDVKPSNVIIQETDGELKAILLDFGIARILADDLKKDQSLTNTGDLIGSPWYMSPEQVSGGKVNEKTDQYSLGCLIYAMFAKEPPLTGDTTLETASLRKNNSVPSLNTISIEPVPEVLDEALLKMLEADANKRFDSIETVKNHFLETLELLAQEEEIEEVNPLKDTLILESTKSNTKSNYLVLALITCTVLALGIITSLTFLFNRKKPEETIKLDLLPESSISVKKVYDPKEYKDIFDYADSLVRPDDFEQFHRVKYLQVFKVRVNPQLEPEILSKFTTLPHLHTLHFEPTEFKFKSLKYFSKLKYLKNLILAGTTVGDAQLDDLKDIKTLHTLDISYSKVTPKGLLKLLKVPSLRQITIDPNLFTCSELKVLAEKMPSCRFIQLEKKVISKTGESPRIVWENTKKRISKINEFIARQGKKINKNANLQETLKRRLDIYQGCYRMAKDAQGADSPAAAECLIQVARVKMAQGNFNEATNIIDQIEEMITGDDGNGDYATYATAEAYRSEFLFVSNRFQKCAESARKARNLKKEYELIVDGAITALYQREIDSLNMLKQFKKAAKVADEYVDYTLRWHDPKYETIDHAIIKSLMQEEKCIAQNPERIKQLRARYDQLQNHWRFHHDPDKPAVSETETELMRMLQANLILSNHEPLDKKIELYEKNIERLKDAHEKYGPNYLYTESDFTISLARLYAQNNQYDKAIESYKRSIDIADKIKNCRDQRQTDFRIELLNQYNHLERSLEAEKLKKEIQMLKPKVRKSVK